MLIKIILGLFACFIVDVKRRDNLEIHFHDSEITYSREIETQNKFQTEKKKQIQKQYKKGKWQKRRSYKLNVVAYQSSKPRDVRFTNQQKLRRMYRNT